MQMQIFALSRLRGLCALTELRLATWPDGTLCGAASVRTSSLLGRQPLLGPLWCTHAFSDLGTFPTGSTGGSGHTYSLMEFV